MVKPGQPLVLVSILCVYLLTSCSTASPKKEIILPSNADTLYVIFHKIERKQRTIEVYKRDSIELLKQMTQGRYDSVLASVEDRKQMLESRLDSLIPASFTLEQRDNLIEFFKHLTAAGTTAIGGYTLIRKINRLNAEEVRAILDDLAFKRSTGRLWARVFMNFKKTEQYRRIKRAAVLTVAGVTIYEICRAFRAFKSNRFEYSDYAIARYTK